jgi:ABC-type Mn2+/Zn2+ transport system ATPase subunit
VQGHDAAGKIGGQATREQDLRSFLGTFNFSGDMVKQAVGSMSGGEKARLVLCMIVWQRPNLLLLDEPTNHLDLATREALAMALNEFEGTVMLVSHDRALLRAVCDEFWLVTRGGMSNPSTATWTTTSATCSTKPSASARLEAFWPHCQPRRTANVPSRAKQEVLGTPGVGKLFASRDRHILIVGTRDDQAPERQGLQWHRRKARSS